MRHWYVSDGNHSHFLVVGEDEAGALQNLLERLRDEFGEAYVAEYGVNYKVTRLPEVGQIEDDDGIELSNWGED